MLEKIVHFSSVHDRYDIRVFHKECVTLAENGYDVTLIVADGKGNETVSGVRIIDIGPRYGGRILRMIKTTKKIFKVVSDIKADLYHFHDPELIPTGVKLKKIYPDSKVIFDSHENYADDIKDKPYIPSLLRNLVSFIYRIYEKYEVRKLDAVVAATPSIKKYFIDIGINSIDINNFPFLDEFSEKYSSERKLYDAVYIGTISRIRGVKELVDAFGKESDMKLILAGSVTEPFLSDLKSSHGWDNVDYLGEVSRKKIKDVLSSAKVAVVTFLPAANHIESQPNKMFEYMSAGLPIVASNFPLWKEIIEGNDCGICVDPSSSAQVESAISKISNNDSIAKSMGSNGRNAVLTKYNWEQESNKLLDFYDEVMR